MRDINNEPLTVGENTYMIDTTNLRINKADASRLIEQDELVNAASSLLPPGYVPGPDSAILDIACGPGGWLREIYHAYPAVTLVGIDNNKPIIEWARRHKKTQHKPNVTFQLMDIMQPLDFADETFDFVNARFLTGVVPHEHWPVLLKECHRILKPGGIIRLTEAELSWMANAPASNRFLDAMIRVMWQGGRAYSPISIAITPMLSYFLTHSGFLDPVTRTITIDWSFNRAMHASVASNMFMTAQIMRGQFVELGIMTDAEFEASSVEMEREAEREAFAALWPIVNCVAHKPI